MDITRIVHVHHVTDIVVKLSINTGKGETRVDLCCPMLSFKMQLVSVVLNRCCSLCGVEGTHTGDKYVC